MESKMNNCCDNYMHHCCKCQSHCCHSSNKKHEIKTDCEMTRMLLKMSDKAWESLFMDKAKAEWERIHGKQMDEVVKAIVDVSMTHHMGMMKNKSEVEEKLEKFKELTKSPPE